MAKSLLNISIIFLCLIGDLSCKTTSQFDKASYLTEYNKQQTVFASHGGVSSESPLASKVGLYILEHGGNAIDAAIAIQLSLAVVYPTAGNIGGGGFMVMRLADGTVKSLDFREKAPAAASKDMFLDENGNPIASRSLHGHLASGVPGTVAGIFESLKFARLPFEKLIQPAIDLAEKGYVLSPGIEYGVGIADSILNTMPNIFNGSYKWKAGDTLKQPDLAKTLKRIKKFGRNDFYEGKTAQLIVAEMQRGGGIITMKDLKDYEAKWRSAQTFTYHGYTIISMGLPSSGGILLNQMLKMIEPFPMSTYGFGSVAAISLMIEAERRAFKDRATYLGDADFSSIPVDNIVNEDYLRKQMNDFVPGVAGKSMPIGIKKMQIESRETTHFSVVDRAGNAVSVTTTLNGGGFF